MIGSLRITDLGVIAKAYLPIGPGLTVLTGETGAGKTMVITALGLLLGERADPAVIRTGSQAAIVEGVWHVPDNDSVVERVHDAGGIVEAGELILVRSIAREGRSRAVVGGRTTPAAVLSELAESLVVVHGQSEQLRLKSRAAQREALDKYAGAELREVLQQYRNAYFSWRELDSQLRELRALHTHRALEADEIREAITAIETVSPRPDEDLELAARAQRLEHLESLRAAAEEAHGLLNGEEDQSLGGIGPLAALANAQRGLERVSQHDAELSAILESVTALGIGVAEASMQLAGYLDGLDAGGSRELESINERRAVLSDIVRRYGGSIEAVLEVLDAGSARLMELEGDDDRIAGLERDAHTTQAHAISLAATLSQLRSVAAKRLEEAVTAELTALAMPTARVVVELEPTAELGSYGTDEVAILLQPHPGSPALPLGRGASGGELSRVMLAIEVVIAEVDPVPTFVFDEVDAGVGGAAAIEVGRRLARLAQTSQVIVVTHLAQVAAFADQHLRVSKDTNGIISESSVDLLTGTAREQEMARLLSGLAESSTGIAHARELLQTARP